MGKKKAKPVDKGRRRFLGWGTALGVGLVVGVYFGVGGEKTKDRVEVWDRFPPGAMPNAWVHIGTDGKVTVRVNHTEMGQGITTALPMILAEELAADWDQVTFDLAPADSVYKNPAYGIQLTGGSTSVRTSWDILRAAGAQARRLLILAAARQWGVDAAQCRAVKGRVEHTGSGRSLGYGELALAAARLEVPDAEVPPESDSYQIIGRSLPRLDARDKITGQAVYGMDLKLPDMLLATVMHPPVFGDGIKSFQSADQVGVPGLTRVMPVSTGLALVGTSFWSLLQARERIKVQWDSQGMTDLDSEQLFKRWEAMAAQGGSSIQDEGNAKEALSSGLDVVQASYLIPYEAHACPEPMNCTARVTKDFCEVWAPTQNQDGSQEVAARICGLSYEAVLVHTPLVGGGFGRRSNVEYVVEAVELSKALGKPVKVIWTREEDVRHDAYRPASYNLVKAGLDQEGRLAAWSHIIVGPDDQGQLVPQLLPSVLPYWVPRGARDLARWLGGKALPLVIPGKAAAEGAAPLAYSVPNVRVEHLQDDPGVPLGFWRSVGHFGNAFVKECFIDEIAHHLGRDPLEFRKPLLQHDPPALAALEDLARRSGWNGPQGPDGLFRGVALHDFHGCKVACLAEVAPASGARPEVRRVLCSVECGRLINPRIAEYQIRGGVVFALTAALKNQVTIKGGAVQQGNFDDLPLLRMDEMPQVEVYFVPSKRTPQGLGESGVPPVAPAVANAFFAATGQRRRRLPLS